MLLTKLDQVSIKWAVFEDVIGGHHDYASERAGKCNCGRGWRQDEYNYGVDSIEITNILKSDL